MCYKIHQNNFIQKEVTEIKKVSATMFIFDYYIRYMLGVVSVDRYFYGMCYKIHENNFSQKEVSTKCVYFTYRLHRVGVVPLISIH